MKKKILVLVTVFALLCCLAGCSGNERVIRVGVTASLLPIAAEGRNGPEGFEIELGWCDFTDEYIDRIEVDVGKNGGSIKGSNPRSMLFAVFRYVQCNLVAFSGLDHLKHISVKAKIISQGKSSRHINVRAIRIKLL